MEDEQGRSWIVYENDTAWHACQLLEKAGLTELRLPVTTLMTGETPEVGSSINLAGLTPELVKKNQSVQEIVRRVTRLNDCIAHLRKEST